MTKANCNWWQYARYIRNIGRSAKQLPFTADELAAIKEFLDSVAIDRPFLVQKLNLAFGNPLPGTAGGAEEPQNVFSYGKALEYVARFFKADPPTNADKLLIDSLIEATGDRKDRVVALPAEEEDDGQTEGPYTYTAYASDNQGTGFSLTKAEGLIYTATITSETAIAEPTLADFAGATWTRIDNGGQE